MDWQSNWRRLALVPGLILALTGCVGDGASSPPDAQLVEVDTYSPVTGNVVGVMRVSYDTSGTATLQPYSAAGEPLTTYRQECRFAPELSPYPAVDGRNVLNALGTSPTGQILLAILGIPSYLPGCQAYFPERTLATEQLWLPSQYPSGNVAERIDILRFANGRLVQRHSGTLVQTTLVPTGFASYDEGGRYLSEGGRTMGMIYGLETWPASGSYTAYPGGFDPLGTLGGLVATSYGVQVSPAVGYALRYSYDARGRLATIRSYHDRGADAQWFSDDDVADAEGLTRYGYDGDLLAQVETGLRTSDGQPGLAYRQQQYLYRGGTLQEKRVFDAPGQLRERWTYAKTTTW